MAKIVSTSFQLSSDLKRRLDKARGNKSLGEEIRQRLEASLGGEDQTGEFMAFIAKCAELLRRDGDWRGNSKLHDIMAAAISDYLSRHAPGPSAPIDAPSFPGDAKEEGTDVSKWAERLMRQ